MADTRETPLGLLPLVPEDGGVGKTTVDVIAVHGMETQFPLTWIAYESDQEPRGRAINWLCDEDMLPRVIPQARIWAYNYNSKCYMANAQEVDIQGLGETFLRLLAAKSNELGRRPLFFIGSCFGGIVVAQALHAASQHGNQFVHILKSTAGVVFLGAPLRGTSIAKLTQWIAFLRGFYGKETSATLLKCLEEKDAYLDSVIQGFAKLAILQPIPVHCFYETRKTHFARALLDKQVARLFGSVKLVPKESACLDGHGRQPLQDARHAMMNKFRGPQDTNFLIVSSCIREFVQNSQVTMNWTPDEIDCLRALSSPYREDKERNPQRVPGTCHWVLDHPKFLQWQEKVTDLLWVSADPGCGKSVLAKALVDERLLAFGNGPGSLCYFFFKDEDAKRQDISTAISAVLHQLFSQQPHLLKHATSQYARHGTNLSGMFHDLWNIFLEATSDPRANEVICVVDALDECYERGRQTLIEQLCYVPTLRKLQGCKVKFLVTSRPYLEIDSDFGRTIDDLNSISLRGEYESETIAQEIDLVIDVQIPRVANSRRIPFSPKIQTALIKKLKSMSNRTYLWLHLILEIIRKSPESTESRLEKLVQKLPRNLSEAYEKILDRVDDPEHKMQARRFLHIVLASASPLTIREMNIAFAIDESLEAGDSYERVDELDLPSEESFRDKLRSICGLFVRIVDSKIFLLHLTARDFLVKELVNHRAESMNHAHWKHSFDLIISNAILAKICMSYLMLEELNRALQFENNTATRTNIHEEPARTIRVRDSKTLVTCGSDAFLQYAARNWARHFKHATARMSQTDLQAALELFNVQAPRFERWFAFSDVINGFSTGTELTGLQAASSLGLSSVVDIYIQRKDEDLNYSQESGATALCFACARAHRSVVQSLLGSGRITINTEDGRGVNALVMACQGGLHENLEVVKLLSHVDGINPNIRGWQHSAPLHYAVLGKFCPIVEQLLKFKDIDVNVADEQQRTPLILAVQPPFLASRKVQLDIVRALLAMKDIDVNAQDRHGCTALTYCAQSGNNAVARLLLSRNDTAVNLRDYEHRYDPLLWSIQNDDIETTKLLLDYPSTGINTLDENKKTYLQWSLMSGSRDMTGLLLSHPDIDVNMIHDNRDTALTYAVKTDKIAIATLLLRHPRIDVNIPDQHCSTALMEAVKLGHAQLVDLLLQNKSIDLVARNSSGETALFLAIKMHHPEIAKTLITPGMPGTAVRNEKAYAEIHWAAQYGFKELFTLLYDEKQVDLEYEDARDDLAMLMAIGIGDINALKSLVDNRKAVDVYKRNTYGETVLFCAVRWDNLEAVKLLLEESDFDLNARNDEDVTVLFLAIEGGFLDICKVLIQNGADMFSTQNEGAFSALDKIILSDHADLLKFVLDNDYDIDASKRVNGETALHAAVRHGSMQTVQLLLDCGSDANAPNDNAETPLHETVRCGNAALARVLLNHGAIVNLWTFTGDELNFRHAFEHDEDVLKSFWQAESFQKFSRLDQFEFFGGGGLEDDLEGGLED